MYKPCPCALLIVRVALTPFSSEAFMVSSSGKSLFCMAMRLTRRSASAASRRSVVSPSATVYTGQPSLSAMVAGLLPRLYIPSEASTTAATSSWLWRVRASLISVALVLPKVSWEMRRVLPISSTKDVRVNAESALSPTDSEASCSMTTWGCCRSFTIWRDTGASNRKAMMLTATKRNMASKALTPLPNIR